MLAHFDGLNFPRQSGSWGRGGQSEKDSFSKGEHVRTFSDYTACVCTCWYQRVGFWAYVALCTVVFVKQDYGEPYMLSERLQEFEGSECQQNLLTTSEKEMLEIWRQHFPSDLKTINNALHWSPTPLGFTSIQLFSIKKYIYHHHNHIPCRHWIPEERLLSQLRQQSLILYSIDQF